METPSVRRLTSARIPTVDGEFSLSLYENNQDDKDHLALVYGDVQESEDVLVRVHSECFTGDVLGSLRCDCGEQLDTSMRQIAENGEGLLIYLRQEGRGIGLLSKLRAYNLQDEGYDTVEANRMLGHGADERDYAIAAKILEDLQVSSVRLLTNNPQKIESLSEHGIKITERISLEPHVNRHNADYLQTKVNRMRHILDLGPANGHARSNAHGSSLRDLKQRIERYFSENDRPFVTLAYAQSLDGSIANESGTPLPVSSEKALRFTNRLRALHDGILVEVATILTDDSPFPVSQSDGTSPVPIVLDSALQFPSDAEILMSDGPDPLIFTAPNPNAREKKQIEKRGGTVIELKWSADEEDWVESLLDNLGERGVASIVVEGDTDILTAFLRRQFVQRVFVTVTPMFVGGKQALNSLASTEDQTDAQAEFPRLTSVQQRWYGENLVLEGDPVWTKSESLSDSA